MDDHEQSVLAYCRRQRPGIVMRRLEPAAQTRLNCGPCAVLDVGTSDPARSVLASGESWDAVDAALRGRDDYDRQPPHAAVPVSAGSFREWHGMKARRDGVDYRGLPIRAGEQIGWNRRRRIAMAADQWGVWCAENAEAALWDRD